MMKSDKQWRNHKIEANNNSTNILSQSDSNANNLTINNSALVRISLEGWIVHAQTQNSSENPQRNIHTGELKSPTKILDSGVWKSAASRMDQICQETGLK